MSLNWDQVLRIAFLVVVPIALVVMGLVLLQEILLPFLVGLAAAYILDPVADRLERLGLGRTAATSVITVGFFFTIASIILLLLPPLASQAANLATELPSYVQRLRDGLLPTVTSLIERFGYGADLSAEGLIKDQAGQAVRIVMSSVAGLLQSGVALMNLIALIFVTPIVTFYMLRDWDRMVAQIRSLVPPRYQTIFDRISHDINEVLAGFLRGQGLVCTFLAIFYGLGLWAIGLNYGLIIGLLTGFFSFVPFIGMAIGMAVGLSVAAFQFQGGCVQEQVCDPQGVCQLQDICQASDPLMIVLVAGIFGLGQFIEGNVISPRLVGSRIHLHPVWMIFAVLAGTTLFGLLGTLLAVPFAAVLGVLIRLSLERYQASALFDKVAQEAAKPAADEAQERRDPGEGDHRKLGTPA